RAHATARRARNPPSPAGAPLQENSRRRSAWPCRGRWYGYPRSFEPSVRVGARQTTASPAELFQPPAGTARRNVDRGQPDWTSSSGETRRPRSEGLLPAGAETGGGSGIRTHDTLLTYTHFPGVRLRPLGHPSGAGRHYNCRKRICNALRLTLKLLSGQANWLGVSGVSGTSSGLGAAGPGTDRTGR